MSATLDTRNIYNIFVSLKPEKLWSFKTLKRSETTALCAKRSKQSICKFMNLFKTHKVEKICILLSLVIVVVPFIFLFTRQSPYAFMFLERVAIPIVIPVLWIVALVVSLSKKTGGKFRIAKICVLALVVGFLAANLSYFYQRPLPTPEGNSCENYQPCFPFLPQAGWPLPYVSYNSATSPYGAIQFDPLEVISADWHWSPYFINWLIYSTGGLSIFILIRKRQVTKFLIVLGIIGIIASLIVGQKSEWQTYRNKDLGFEFQYPISWGDPYSLTTLRDDDILRIIFYINDPQPDAQFHAPCPGEYMDFYVGGPFPKREYGETRQASTFLVDGRLAKRYDSWTKNSKCDYRALYIPYDNSNSLLINSTWARSNTDA